MKKICTKKNIERFINECSIDVSKIENILEELYPSRFVKDVSHMYASKKDTIGIYIIKYLYRNYDFVNRSLIIKNIKLMAETGELRIYESSKEREMDYIFCNLLKWVKNMSESNRDFHLSEFINEYNCDGYCFISKRRLKEDLYSYMEERAKKSMTKNPYKYCKCFNDKNTFNPGYFIFREYKEFYCKRWIGEVGDGHYEYVSDVPIHCYSETTEERDVFFTKERYRWFNKYQCYEFEATEEQIQEMNMTIFDKISSWLKKIF